MFIFLSSHTLIFILYISPLQPDESPPVILFFLYILSTQPTLNNPISTTYPISNLSTQLSHPKSSGYVTAQYNRQKIREPEQFFQTVPTPGNPLFSALFRYSISPPLTSTRHTQHVLYVQTYLHTPFSPPCTHIPALQQGLLPGLLVYKIYIQSCLHQTQLSFSKL